MGSTRRKSRKKSKDKKNNKKRNINTADNMKIAFGLLFRRVGEICVRSLGFRGRRRLCVRRSCRFKKRELLARSKMGDPSTSYLKFAPSTLRLIYDRNCPEERRWKVAQIFHAPVPRLYLETFSVQFVYLLLIFAFNFYLKQVGTLIRWSVSVWSASLLVTGEALNVANSWTLPSQ